MAKACVLRVRAPSRSRKAPPGRSTCTVPAGCTSAPRAARISTESSRPCSLRCLTVCVNVSVTGTTQRGASALPSQLPLAIGSHEDALIAVPARAPPVEFAALGSARPWSSPLAQSGSRPRGRWRRRRRSDCLDLGPNIPSVLPRPTAPECRFFLYKRGITHRFQPGSSADRWPAPGSGPRHASPPDTRHPLIVSYLCPVISSAARKLPRRITINSAWATSQASVFNPYIGVPCVSPK